MPTTVRQEEKRVIGLAIRTRNADDQSVGAIAALWGRFMEGGYAARIPGRLNPDALLGVYTDYASDRMGDYTFIVGAEVEAGATPPEGMVAATLPASRRARFDVEGPLPAAVAGAWAEIWGSRLPRAYQADFEVYDAARGRDGRPAVEIFISLKGG